MTRFGMVERDFEEFAALFAAAVREEKGVGERVAAFRHRFQEMRFCFTGDDIGPLQERLLRTF
jgi:aminomethyltransferase